jgi:hypothetical protein
LLTPRRYPGKAPTVPQADDNYHAELFPGEWRKDIKPLDIVQPDGPSFSVEGNLVQWQKWQLRVGFNYREGLVLHQVRGGAALPRLCEPGSRPSAALLAPHWRALAE